MPRRAQPINLIVNNGKSHKTKAEIKARQDAEIKPNTDKVEPPEWLTESAKNEFVHLVEELKAVDLATNLDVNALAIYCDTLEQYKNAMEIVREQGTLVKYTNKAKETNTIENPAVKTANKCALLMHKIANDFGFTPGSRAKLAIKATEPKQDDAKAQFENRFKGI